MTLSVPSIIATLRRPPWLQKAARTGFAVLPGLLWWAATDDTRGIIFAFAALCIAASYGGGVRARHMLGMGLIGALLLPGATWIEARPLACVPVIMAMMIAYVLIRRRTALPERLSTWLLIFLLYQSSELNAEGVAPCGGHTERALEICTRAAWLTVGLSAAVLALLGWRS